MTIRELYDALQSGDLTVVPEVTDVLGELADVIDMLEDANLLEQQEAVEHLKLLDFSCSSVSQVVIYWKKDNLWF